MKVPANNRDFPNIIKENLGINIKKSVKQGQRGGTRRKSENSAKNNKAELSI